MKKVQVLHNVKSFALVNQNAERDLSLKNKQKKNALFLFFLFGTAKRKPSQCFMLPFHFPFIVLRGTGSVPPA